jgi:AcrR family transcriptional regulator
MGKEMDLNERELKRSNIMNAALKIFSKKGYGTTALDEVAQEAGIAKGTLYLYFRDKEDLFCSTLLNFVENLADYLKSHINEKMGPLEILESIAFNELNFFSQNKDCFGIFQTILHENLLFSHEKLFTLLLQKKRDLINYEVQVVEKGKKEGLIRKDIDTEDIVISFDGILTNAIHQFGSMGVFTPPEDVLGKTHSMMKVLFNGIRTG